MGWWLAVFACREDEPRKVEVPLPTGPPIAEAGEPVVVTVGQTAVFNGFDSIDGAGFLWRFDDGVELTGALVNRTWDAPGHFTGVLEVTNPNGVDSDTVSVTVTWPALPERPTASGPIAGDATSWYVVMPDFDLVAVVDRVTLQARDGWATCDGPRALALGHGHLWVACEHDDQVDVFTPAGLRTGRIGLGFGSRPVALVTRSTDVLVALQGTGALAQLDPAGAWLATVAVGPDVRGLAAYTGGVLVSRWRSPDAGGEVTSLDPALQDVLTWTLAPDPGPDSDTNSRGVPTLLQSIAIRPDGRVAAIGGLKSNIERGLVRDGLPLTFETANRSDLRTLALDPAEGAPGSPLDAAIFDDRDLVSAAAYGSVGDWLYVLHRGMETIDVLDASTLSLAGSVQDVGHGADGLWVSEDGAELVVSAPLSRELRVYDPRTMPTPTWLATIDLLPPTGEVLDPVVLEGAVLFGRSVDPRMCSGGYLSCYSCHPDGSHDGRTWDFTDRGEGLRNTISLLGRGGRAPIHWSANFDEVQDFENDIRGPMAGLGFLSEADWVATAATLDAPKAGLSPELDALAAYVESLSVAPRSPFRDPSGALTAEAVLGATVFFDPAVGCASCHTGSAASDSAFGFDGEPLLHDVGTLGPASGQRLGGPLLGLDTPDLLGLADTAPYLHDGAAATLRDVLVDHNVGDSHGTTSTLSPAALAALESFLRQQ